MCDICQVEALNATLSDNLAALAASQERVPQLQRVIVANEHDRRVLQERLDSTRSVVIIIIIIVTVVVIINNCSALITYYDSSLCLRKKRH